MTEAEILQPFPHHFHPPGISNMMIDAYFYRCVVQAEQFVKRFLHEHTLISRDNAPIGPKT